MSIKEKLKTNTYMPHLDMYTEKKKKNTVWTIIKHVFL